MPRKQEGRKVKISGLWYVRYWERRTIRGAIERKRVSHLLGPVTTRGKYVPEDIKNEGAKHMATINHGSMAPSGSSPSVILWSRSICLGSKSTGVRAQNGYRHIWENHLKPICGNAWLKETRTYHVQAWLNHIGASSLSRNTLKHIKSVSSGIFTLAKQQDYFQGENAARDTAINPAAKEPEETYAYSLQEIESLLSVLPEPAATAFAVAAFTGLRHGEIEDSRGRTIATVSYLSPVLSGGGRWEIPKHAKDAPQFQ